MANFFIDLGAANTGLVLANLTFYAYDTDGAAATITATAATELTNIPGTYAITATLSGSGVLRVRAYKTADTAVWWEGDVYPYGAPSTTTGDLLCTVEKVKSMLNITDSSKDTLVEDKIDEASRWFERRTGRTFTSTSYTEYFSPGYRDDRVFADRTGIRPKNYPIISVTSLYDDDDRTWTDPDDLIAAADYFLGDNGHTVELYDDGDTVVFNVGQRTVRLIYTAGYATIPSDVQQAVAMLAVHLYHAAERQKAGIASESIGDLTVTYKDQAMPKEVEAIADLYTRPCGW